MSLRHVYLLCVLVSGAINTYTHIVQISTQNTKINIIAENCQDNIFWGISGSLLVMLIVYDGAPVAALRYLSRNTLQCRHQGTQDTKLMTILIFVRPFCRTPGTFSVTRLCLMVNIAWFRLYSKTLYPNDFIQLIFLEVAGSGEAWNRGTKHYTPMTSFN